MYSVGIIWLRLNTQFATSRNDVMCNSVMLRHFVDRPRWTCVANLRSFIITQYTLILVTSYHFTSRKFQVLKKKCLGFYILLKIFCSVLSRSSIESLRFIFILLANSRLLNTFYTTLKNSYPPVGLVLFEIKAPDVKFTRRGLSGGC